MRKTPAQYDKTLIPIFQHSSASIQKMFSSRGQRETNL